MPRSSLLEGISEKSTKAEILERLRSGEKQLAAIEDERVGALQEIEEGVRRRYAVKPQDLRQVLVTSTPEEWTATVDFLENFDDLLPVTLVRVREGARVVVEESNGKK